MELDERLNKTTEEEIKNYKPFTRKLTKKEIDEIRSFK